MTQTSDLLETAERRSYVLKMRKGGATYAQIVQGAIKKFGADMLPSGWDERYAYKDVKRELDRLRSDISENAEQIIELEKQRLDAMLTTLWPKVAQGHQGAIDRVLRIMERRARLLGLDAPSRHSGQVDVTTKGESLNAINDTRAKLLADITQAIAADEATEET